MPDALVDGLENRGIRPPSAHMSGGHVHGNASDPRVTLWLVRIASPRLLGGLPWSLPSLNEGGPADAIHTLNRGAAPQVRIAVETAKGLVTRGRTGFPVRDRSARLRPIPTGPITRVLFS